MKTSLLSAFAAIGSASLVGAVAAATANSTGEYDYVVIGSGPGGGPLAANLAREGFSVFLLEAGGNQGDDLLQQIPRWYNLNAEHPEMSWQFFVETSRNETQSRRGRYYTYRLSNGTLWYGVDPPEDAEPLGIFYPRGATVGGSAISNAMNVLLPPDADWNVIADATGDESWRAENVRPYFEELERNTYVENALDHGYDGYISTSLNNISYIVDRPGVLSICQNAIADTEDIPFPNADEVAERMQRDMNRADADRYEVEGVYQVPLHIDENRRRSSPWNYIAETLAAKKTDGSPLYPLTLSTHSLATKVLISTNGTEPKAYGVEYLKGEAMYAADRRYDASVNGELKMVRARKEVIVAGGAFNTPQILKLSGLGPKEELEEHGILVVVDLPAVGEYLQDNYEIGINVQSQVEWENNPNAECRFDPSGTPESDPCLAEWLEGYGGYGEGATPIFMFYRTELSESSDSDLILFGSTGAVFDGHFPGYSVFPRPPESLFFNAVKMQNNNPTGSVRLRSADPRDVPEINLSYFDEGADVDLPALVEGLEHIWASVNKTGAPYTPFTVIDPPSDRSIEQHVRDNTFGHHVSGSCRIGKDGSDSCVDSKFRVHGVDGLRVVDGSVFVRAPGGFPVGATYTVGQKAFHDILGDAGASTHHSKGQLRAVSS